MLRFDACVEVEQKDETFVDKWFEIKALDETTAKKKAREKAKKLKSVKRVVRVELRTVAFAI